MGQYLPELLSDDLFDRLTMSRFDRLYHRGADAAALAIDDADPFQMTDPHDLRLK
jgi:hypothetical protein